MNPASHGSRVGYRLVSLDCAQCGAPLAAEGDDVVYYCTACRSGFQLDPTAEKLVPVEVSFVAAHQGAAGRMAAGQVVAEQYLPFWLLPAQVRIDSRNGRSPAEGTRSPIARFFFGDRQETGYPAGEGTFAIPAFQTPLQHATALAARYTAAFPALGQLLGERLTGGIHTPDDAQTLAHFTLIAAEAEKPDTLRDLEYQIEFGKPRLLGVPFRHRGKERVDSIFGLRG